MKSDHCQLRRFQRRHHEKRVIQIQLQNQPSKKNNKMSLSALSTGQWSSRVCTPYYEKMMKEEEENRLTCLMIQFKCALSEQLANILNYLTNGNIQETCRCCCCCCYVRVRLTFAAQQQQWTKWSMRPITAAAGETNNRPADKCASKWMKENNNWRDKEAGGAAPRTGREGARIYLCCCCHYNMAVVLVDCRL